MKQSNRHFFRSILTVYVAVLLPNLLYPLHAGIHKCVTDSSIEYTDTHCSAGILIKHSPGYQTIGRIEGLSQGELETLQEMETAYRNSRAQTDKDSAAQKKLMFRERARKRQERARSCARAIKGLEQLRITKRKGYSAKQARNLDSRQNVLEQQKRKNCT